MFGSRTGRRRPSASTTSIQLYHPIEQDEVASKRSSEATVDSVVVQNGYAYHKPDSQAIALEGHVGSLDGLRGVACIFAMLHHIELTPAFVGHYGVSIFFVLSGFLISGILANARVNGSSGVWNYLSTFYTARFVRLVPAQLVLVVGSYVWLRYMNAAHYSNAMLARAYLRVLSSTEDFKSPHHPLQNCWSLAVEEWSYIFLSTLMLVLPTGRKTRLTAFGVIAVSFFAVKAYVIRSSVEGSLFEWQSTSYFGFPPFNVHWEFGFVTNAWKIFLGALFRLTPWPAWLCSARKTSVMLSVLLIGVIHYNGTLLTSQGFTTNASRSLFVDPFVALLAGFTIVTSLHGNALLEFNTVRYVGRISYSLYLWQWPVIDSINWGNGKWAKAGATGLAFIFAHLSTTYVEEPISQAYRSYKKRRDSRS